LIEFSNNLLVTQSIQFMLTDLNIHNYAIADLIELELDSGMTAITGETGAGKSITLDALGLALGDRADSTSVGSNGEKAEITASFDISNNSQAQRWLSERELDNDNDCFLRRLVKRDGKSKAYINNRPATVQDMRQLGELLINIHGQHEHQALLKRDTQRQIIDDYASSQTLVSKVREAFEHWNNTKGKLENLRNTSSENAAKVEFLRYQIQELEQLAIEENELEKLEEEQKTLANAETIIVSCQQALTLCDNDDTGTETSLAQVIHLLDQLPQGNAAIIESLELFNSALIQLQEGGSTLSNYIDSFEADPARLSLVEDRLSAIYDLARKHRIDANQVSQLLTDLNTELDSLDCSDEKLAELENLESQQLNELLALCSQLTKKRKAAASKLQKAVGKQLQALRMANCSIEFALTELEQPNQYGKESIELLITTNPAQAPQALGKIASGGELSRIGLAIQVITAQTTATPTLIFDEVDSGIGGAVAEVVGKLLRELGEKTQVMCVTHLPQVACQANQHFIVDKTVSKKQVQTNLQQLSEAQRLEEIARMLGGVEITQQTRAHAKELLESAASS
jgi:DNA repair protein RecN (Recombination protein N)